MKVAGRCTTTRMSHDRRWLLVEGEQERVTTRRPLSEAPSCAAAGHRLEERAANGERLVADSSDLKGPHSGKQPEVVRRGVLLEPTRPRSGIVVVSMQCMVFLSGYSAPRDSCREVRWVGSSQ